MQYEFPRRTLTAVAVLLLLVLTLFGAPRVGQAADQPPNIVLIVADDLGYAELGCYGQKHIQTPHIDRLASEGMRFTQFYSGNAVCAPSRCCLMTGKHPGHAHVRNNGKPEYTQHLRDEIGWEFPGQHPLPAEEITLGELLKRRGYQTAAIGKWGLGHVGTTGDPNRQGFDLFYGFNCQRHAHNHYPKFLWRNHEKEILPGNSRELTGETYSQDRFRDVALEFIDAHRDEPFFLYLPFAIPHLSIQVPDDSLKPYRNAIPEEEYEHRGYLKHPAPRAGYAAMISHMDRDIGRIVARLEQHGLTEQTVVLFTSDNGPTYDRLGGSDSEFFASAGPLRGLKGSLYEGGIRVPLVARWPGQIPAGTESDHISAFWDLLPTLCEFAGVDVPAGLDGISFAATLRGEAEQQTAHEFLYWEFPGYGGQQAVRAGKWKAIRQGLMRLRRPEQIETELYDLQTDVGEQTNVAPQHPEIVRELEAVMRREHTPSELFPLGIIDR